MKKNGSGFDNALRFFCVLVVIMFGLLAIIGSSGGSSSGDGDNNNGGNGGGEPVTITGESGDPVSLDGTWSSACDYDAGDEEAETYSITVSGSTFTQVQNIWFESMTCSGSSDVTVTMNGSFSLGNEVTASMNGSDVTATTADVNFSSYKGIINNADLVSEFNTEKTCGFDNWAVDTPKELIGTDCAPDSNIKDTIYVDDTADPDVWYNSDDEGGTDANGYPTEIDSDSAKERT